MLPAPPLDFGQEVDQLGATGRQTVVRNVLVLAMDDEFLLTQVIQRVGQRPVVDHTKTGVGGGVMNLGVSQRAVPKSGQDDNVQLPVCKQVK